MKERTNRTSKVIPIAATNKPKKLTVIPSQIEKPTNKPHSTTLIVASTILRATFVFTPTA